MNRAWAWLFALLIGGTRAEAAGYAESACHPGLYFFQGDAALPKKAGSFPCARYESKNKPRFLLKKLDSMVLQNIGDPVVVIEEGKVSKRTIIGFENAYSSEAEEECLYARVKTQPALKASGSCIIISPKLRKAMKGLEKRVKVHVAESKMASVQALNLAESLLSEKAAELKARGPNADWTPQRRYYWDLDDKGALAKKLTEHSTCYPDGTCVIQIEGRDGNAETLLLKKGVRRSYWRNKEEGASVTSLFFLDDQPVFSVFQQKASYSYEEFLCSDAHGFKDEVVGNPDGAGY